MLTAHQSSNILQDQTAFLAALDAPYKVAILGDMLEMGTHSLTEHQQIIAQLHQFGFNQVVLVGSEFAKADVPNSPFLHFATATDAQQWYAQQLFNHTYVLLKASRGIALEKVIETMDWNKKQKQYKAKINKKWV